jgi:hypothetical protein
VQWGCEEYQAQLQLVAVALLGGQVALQGGHGDRDGRLHLCCTALRAQQLYLPLLLRLCGRAAK